MIKLTPFPGTRAAVGCARSARSSYKWLALLRLSSSAWHSMSIESASYIYNSLFFFDFFFFFWKIRSTRGEAEPGDPGLSLFRQTFGTYLLWSFFLLRGIFVLVPCNLCGDDPKQVTPGRRKLQGLTCLYSFWSCHEKVFHSTAVPALLQRYEHPVLLDVVCLHREAGCEQQLCRASAPGNEWNA